MEIEVAGEDERAGKIFSGRQEERAAPGAGDSVDGFLERGGVEGLAIADRAVVSDREGFGGDDGQRGWRCGAGLGVRGKRE